MRLQNLLPAAAVLLLLGLLVWRESNAGFLRHAEISCARWVAGISHRAHTPKPPALIFQGGLDSGQLGALDIGLFARAARKLSARVAGVAVWEFPSSEVSLDVRPFRQENLVHTQFIAGVLLMNNPARGGLAPVTLPKITPSDWKLAAFRGSYSGFAPGLGWTGGFVNLPEATGARSGFPVIAQLGEQVVASFPLTLLLGAIPEISPAEITGTPASGLRIGNFLLPLDESGSLPLDAGLLARLTRLDMDDVLVNVERLERGGAVDEAIRSAFADATVLLGTVAAESSGQEIRIGSGRRFSLAEFQGLALASLQNALSPLPLPPGAQVFIILLAAALAVVVVVTSRRYRIPLFFALLAGWGLFVIAFNAESGSMPPILAPLAVLLISLPLRSLLFPDSSRNETRP